MNQQYLCATVWEIHYWNEIVETEVVHHRNVNKWKYRVGKAKVPLSICLFGLTSIVFKYFLSLKQSCAHTPQWKTVLWKRVEVRLNQMPFTQKTLISIATSAPSLPHHLLIIVPPSALPSSLKSTASTCYHFSFLSSLLWQSWPDHEVSIVKVAWPERMKTWRNLMHEQRNPEHWICGHKFLLSHCMQLLNLSV